MLTKWLSIACGGALIAASVGSGGCSRTELQEEHTWAQEQRASLTHLYHRHNDPPPPPTAQELRQVTEKMTVAQPWERGLLESLYPADPELWVYATRDSDGDGIFDFRVSEYFGRFLEGDTDLDGDGWDNVLDPEPYAPTREVADPSLIPAAVDWATQGKPAAVAEIQRELFANHRILLVERSATFTPELARAVYDVITRIYREIFADNGTLPTLRVIATEESSLLDPEDEAGADDFAQVFAATQTLEIYRRGIDALPVIQIGYLAHEIAHNIQFSLDYDARRQDEIVRRNYFAAAHFFDLVEPYGWTLHPVALDPEAEFSLFRPQYTTQEPYTYVYQGETVAEWESWLSEIYAEVGEEHYLTDERLTTLHIVGDYSLTGPWEWYSDQVIAYVYLSMLDALRDRCPPQNWTALGERFQNETVVAEWPYFRFANARGADIQIHLSQVYPIAPADAAYLAEQYLVPTQPGLCPAD